MLSLIEIEENAIKASFATIYSIFYILTWKTKDCNFHTLLEHKSGTHLQSSENICFISISSYNLHN